MTLIETRPVTASRHAMAPILGLGTAIAPSVSQEEVETLTRTFSCDNDQHRSFHHRIFSRAGVEQRGTVLISNKADRESDLRAFYPERTGPEDLGPTTAARMIRYAQEAPPLAARAAEHALKEAGVIAASITHLITVSCTGFVAPGIDVELIQRLGLSPDVQRLHIGFMGCHAAFNALTAARNIHLADPEACILVCCVELSTLHFAYGWDPEKLIANALFADGAAAAVIGDPCRRLVPSENAASHAWHVQGSASLLLPGTCDAMTWRIRDHGFEMTLSPTLPKLLETQLRPWVEGFLAKHGLTLADIHHFPIHPGGPKVLDSVAAALTLPDNALDTSRDILARRGNMSSATVLFILQKMAGQQMLDHGLALALGFGPGLMMEALLLDLH